MSEGTNQPCLTCRNSGWILKQDDSTEVAVPCPECRATRKLGGLLRNAEIPPRYFDSGFPLYFPENKSQEKALTRAIDYVAKFPDVQRGLLFVGPCGVGKTHLSVAILKALITEKEVSGRFVDESELLRRLQYSYGQDSPETEREVLRPLMNVDLLVWDDLGTGRRTDWVGETIRTVLNYRYTYNRQTILSTNRPLKIDSGAARSSSLAREMNLAEQIGRPLFSRIMEMCEIIDISGSDWRIDHRKAGLDFEPSRPQSDRVVIPAALLKCPKCGSLKIDQRGTSKLKPSKAGEYVEVACYCTPCARDFVARFYLKKGEVQYPEIG